MRKLSVALTGFALLIVLGGLTFVVRAGAAPPPAIGDAHTNLQALDPLLLIRGLSPTRLGVDSHGNLWGWNERSSRLLVVTPSAGLLTVVELPPARAIDVDSTHGVVLLDLYGKQISVLDATGEARKSWTLPNEGADVTWIDADRVAISTTRSAPPIELWNVERGARSSSFGDGPAVEVGRGATLLRHLDLNHHAASRTLYALDSVEGTLTAYALDGSPKGRHQVPNPKRAELADWLADADREARALGRVETPLYTILRSGVGPDGAAWIVTRCSEDRRVASLERWAPESEPRRVELTLSDACCSLAFTIWRERALFTHKPDAVAQRCVVDRRLP